MFETEIPEAQTYKGPAGRYIVFGSVNLVMGIFGTYLVVGNAARNGGIDTIQPFVVAMFYLNGILWLWRSRKVISETPASTVLGIENSEKSDESHE